MSAKKSLIGGLVLGLGIAASGQAQTFTLPAAADTFLRAGGANQNGGSATVLELSGSQRALVRMDQAAVVSAVGSGRLVSASLELYVRTASGWGPDGRSMEAHRLTADWTEAGATWNCGIDAQPTNSKPDCAPQWAGGTFEEDPADTVLHTNDTHGPVRFDVTADVAAFLAGTPNRGWLLKREDESGTGRVDYASREGATAERPRLVLLVETAADDQVPPSLAITSPARSILVGEPSPTVTLAYTDGGSGVDTATLQLLVDGQDASASCTTGPQSASCQPVALAAGDHTLEALLRDHSGNQAHAIFSFRLFLGTGPHLVTFPAVADTYLRKGAPNQNQGMEPIVRVQQSGHNRALVQIDPQSLAATLAGATLLSATLELHVQENGGNWGTEGRTVDAHRLTAAWTELGATWSCPNDSNPANGQPDCTPQWNGGSFAAAPTASVLHTRNLTGWVIFDVTADVAAFLSGSPSHGWLIKKTDETKSGRMDYDSRQGTAGEGPRLVVVFETPGGGEDTEAPVVAITTPAESSFWNTPDVLVTGTVADDGQVASVTVNDVEAALNEGNFQAAVTLQEGFNEIVVVATDATGKQSFATRTVTLDLTPPSLSVESPAPGQLTNQGEIPVAGEATDENGLESLTVQQESVSVADDRFETVVEVLSGANRITVRALDRAGNETLVDIPVTRFDLPAVTITSPEDLSFLATTTVDVSGTVNEPGAAVTVNGVAAVVSGTTFLAREVPLIEGGNILTATAADANGHVGTDSINVVRDRTAPRLAIRYPRDGATLFEPTVTVMGLVNDVVAGTVNASEVTVTVNGRLATVANRSFLVQGVPLSLGDNVLTAEAVDASGNLGQASLTLHLAAANVPRITMVSGNLQEAVIGTALPAPLTVSLLDATGQPIAGKPVLFKLRNNNGSLDGGKRQIAVTTDAAGRASAHFILGTRAGAGNQIVEATSPGFQGSAVFLATALPGEPAFLVVDSGDQQVGIAGQDLPRPLVAVVTDVGHNRLEGAAVKLSVVKGRGHFANGSQEALAFSDSDGRVILPLTLDPEEGIANNVVEARIEGLADSPLASFVASGRAAGDPTATSVSGVVLDNSNLPIAGVTLRILDTPLTAQTDEKGLFRIPGAPVGTVKLIVDGSTADRPGSWPDLEFVLTTIPGRDNTVNMPIYLLPLDLRSGLAIDETHGGTLTLPEIPGFALEILPGSVTFPGDSRSGVVSVTAVHNDKVPMVPNFGQQPRFIVTIQPAGARFEPPARLTLPNLEGLAPGEVTEMYSFDHDLGHFVSIGPATVSESGEVITSDPGVGIAKAGWHCGGNPATAGTPHQCPQCTVCNGSRCVPGCQTAQASRDLAKAAQDCTCTLTKPCLINPTCDGKDGCVGKPVEVTEINGFCAAPPNTPMTFTAKSNAPAKVGWNTSPSGVPQTGNGATFTSRWNSTGPKAVAAGCGSNPSKRKDVRIVNKCSVGVTEPKISPLTPMVPPDKQGLFETKGIFFTEAECTDSPANQYCLTLTKFESPAGYDIRPHFKNEISIESAADSVVTDSTCEAILRDITPLGDGRGQANRPPTQTYWSRTIADLHERKHFEDWVTRVVRPTFNEFKAWLVTKCPDCGVPPPTAEVTAEFRRILGPNLDEFDAGLEDRAYNISNPLYQAIADSIRARARQESWRQECQ